MHDFPASSIFLVSLKTCQPTACASSRAIAPKDTFVLYFIARLFSTIFYNFSCLKCCKLFYLTADNKI
ncbi:MAG TPA: hypothetical protein DD738_12005 [Ruminiclostridium sp.]|nr:hypothetical protein [Ruminiclostridium sp.]